MPCSFGDSPADHEVVVAVGVGEGALDEARVGVGGALQHGVPPLPLIHALVRLVSQELKCKKMTNIFYEYRGAFFSDGLNYSCS